MAICYAMVAVPAVIFAGFLYARRLPDPVDEDSLFFSATDRDPLVPVMNDGWRHVDSHVHGMPAWPAGIEEWSRIRLEIIGWQPRALALLLAIVVGVVYHSVETYWAQMATGTGRPKTWMTRAAMETRARWVQGALLVLFWWHECTEQRMTLISVLLTVVLIVVALNHQALWQLYHTDSRGTVLYASFVVWLLTEVGLLTAMGLSLWGGWFTFRDAADEDWALPASRWMTWVAQLVASLLRFLAAIMAAWVDDYGSGGGVQDLVSSYVRRLDWISAVQVTLLTFSIAFFF
jgi:hypothetical protein